MKIPRLEFVHIRTQLFNDILGVNTPHMCRRKIDLNESHFRLGREEAQALWEIGLYLQQLVVEFGDDWQLIHDRPKEQVEQIKRIIVWIQEYAKFVHIKERERIEMTDISAMNSTKEVLRLKHDAIKREERGEYDDFLRGMQETDDML